MRGTVFVALVMLAGCVDDPGQAQTTDPPVEDGLPDPLGPGPLAVTSQVWSGQAMVATGSPSMGAPRGVYPIEMRGTLHAPPLDDGPYPVAVLMHGRHATCRYVDTAEFLGAACPDAPPAMEPVWSERGYEYLGEFLASHGIVAVSVNANNVNDHDLTWSLAGDDSGATARAQVIGEVLRRLTDAQAGTPVSGWPDMTGALDLSKVGLMGHSRGGEGVAAATALIQRGDIDPGEATIQAVFALAPTDFARWRFTVPAFATLLPYCDGDVSNLQGAWMYDDNRFDEGRGELVQFVAVGANHNFYNTVWTGDDFGNRGDPWCDAGSSSSGRDTPESQRTHGLALMATFLRVHLTGEDTLRPYVDGTAAWPQPGIWTSHMRPQARDRSAAIFDRADGMPGIGAGTCQGTACPGQVAYPAAAQRLVEWSDGPHVLPIPDDVRSARFNIIPGEDVSEQVLVRADGTWTLADLGVLVPPGDSHARSTLNQVWLPPGGGRTLEFHGEGRLLTADWLA